jgi:hypothetical protein
MFSVLSEVLGQGDQRAEPKSFRVVTKSPPRVTTSLDTEHKTEGLLWQ